MSTKSPRRAFRRYFFTALPVLVLIPAALAVFNLVVDPYHAWSGLSPRFLEPYRQMRNRKAKAEILRRGHWQVLLMGSSRMESALDPAHPAWRGRRVYNAGMNRYSVSELVHILRTGLACQDFESVIVGLDFFGFNALRGYDRSFEARAYLPPRALDARRSAAVEFETSRFNPELSVPAYFLSVLLGRDSTSDSIETINRWAERAPGSFTREGFHRPRPRTKPVATLFLESLRNYLTSTSLYGRWTTGYQHRDAIQQMISHCHGRGVAPTFVILPVHALHMEAIDAAGLWSAFERWKRDLVEIVGAHEKFPAGATVLFDFQAYNGFTTEPLPLGDDHRPMRFFMESSHCSHIVGDQVIERLLSTDGDRPEGRPPFGVKLTVDNVDTHLHRLRQDRQRYRQENPAQIVFFGKVLEEIGPELLR